MLIFMKIFGWSAYFPILVVNKFKALISTSDLLAPPKSLTVWITKKNCGKFLKRWEYQTILPAFREICMQVKKQQLELEMEWQIGSKLGKEYIKTVLVSLLV